MATTTTTRKATVADFDELPPETRVQLVNGVLLHEPAPSYRHQRAIARLMLLLGAHARDNGAEVLCAPIDVELGEHDVFQPDVIYITEARRAIITEKRIAGAPDVVVEILSPATSHIDLHTKKRVYEAAGVGEYWIVDPVLQTLDLLVNSNSGFDDVLRFSGNEPVTSTVLPTLVLAPRSLFE